MCRTFAHYLRRTQPAVDLRTLSASPARTSDANRHCATHQMLMARVRIVTQRDRGTGGCASSALRYCPLSPRDTAIGPSTRYTSVSFLPSIPREPRHEARDASRGFQEGNARGCTASVQSHGGHHFGLSCACLQLTKHMMRRLLSGCYATAAPNNQYFIL